MARRAALAIVVLLTAGAALWWMLHPQTSPFLWQAWTPRDAEVVVWTEPLGRVRRELHHLTEQIPGSKGLRDITLLTAGLDLDDPDALGNAGLRDDAPLLAFRWQGAEWLAVAVRDESGARHILQLWEHRGYHVARLEAGQWSLADRSHLDREAGRAWHRDGVLLLRAGPNPEPALAAYLQAPRHSAADWSDRPGAAHLHARLDKDTLRQVHEVLGPANLLIGGAIDRLEQAEVDAVLTPVPGMHARLESAPGALADVAAYHSGFRASVPGTQAGPRTLLPDETPLLLQARINPAMLAMVPTPVRDAVLPATLLTQLHPSLVGIDARQQVLDVWDGQVGLAILGIDDSVPLDPRAWHQLSWRTALRVAVTLSLRTDQDASTLLQRVRSALETTPDKPVTVQLRSWAGFAVAGPEAPWMLLQNERTVAFVSGTGELEDLQRTATGRFPDLEHAARGDLERSIVLAAPWIGALATTPRIVRSLRRRGMPDYVVQLLASLATVSTAVVLEPDAIRLDVQVRPARTEAP